MRFQKLQDALDSGFLKPALCKFPSLPLRQKSSRSALKDLGL